MYVLTASNNCIDPLTRVGMRIANRINDFSLSHSDVFEMSENDTLIKWMDENNLIFEWDEDDKKVLEAELFSALNCIDTDSETGAGVLIFAIFYIIQGGGFSRTLADVM